ncbi:MAG: hypothetical protein JST05_05015 [Acidobacteria bacterium]|nr:hypothetical protein [Acidobacteriota bacterium]
MFDPRAVFLGPQGQNADLLERLTLDGLRDHVHWRRGFHPEDPDAVDPFRQLEPAHLQTRARFETYHRRLLARLKGSIPSHSPRYLAHMMGDTLLPAQVGYAAAMLYNPNNVATEGSPVTTELEREVAADLAGLLGFDPAKAFGHLCGGGTVANLEALWVLRNLALRPLAAGRPEDLGRRDAESLAALPQSFSNGAPPKPFAVLAPVTAHYSWIKAMDLLGLGRENLVAVAVDEGLRMDLGDLEAQLDRLAAEDRPVLACIGVVGTTEGGGVDPVDGILAVRERYRARHGRWFLLHLDAAYGGYARALLRNEDGSLRSLEQVREQLPEATESFHRAFARMGEADSITVDPHKLGFVPYPAGALVLRHAAMREAIGCHAAYLNAADPSHLGSFILEGSKPGAAAAACWMAHRVVPLDHTGYGVILAESFRSAHGLAELLTHADFGGARCEVLQPPDLDVLLYAFGPGGRATLEAVNALTDRVLAALPSNGSGPFALTSTWVRPEELGGAMIPFLARLGVDAEEWKPGTGLRLVRSALMTPFVADPAVKAFYRGRLVTTLRTVLS